MKWPWTQRKAEMQPKPATQAETETSQLGGKTDLERSASEETENLKRVNERLRRAAVRAGADVSDVEDKFSDLVKRVRGQKSGAA